MKTQIKPYPIWKPAFFYLTLIIFLASIFFPTDLLSQPKNFGDEFNLNEEQKEEVIEKISGFLIDNYIFPETAEKMKKFINDQLDNGKYDEIKNAFEFSEVLTKDLRDVCKDKHLGVVFDPDLKESLEKKKGDKEKLTEEEIEAMKYENYGFKKVERMNGNIGYVDFRAFYPVEHGEKTAVSAMNFLANCDAIIIDLRSNGGGEPKMVQFICSYFFDSKPVHLNSLYYRAKDTTEEYWTLKEIPGKRMPDVDLYVLTSNRTFSGAEEFAYNIKSLKRGTIVGEVTGGGAHPTDMFPINDFLCIYIPNGKAINPITKTNWEGVGVIPDIEVSQDIALQTAQIEAMKKLMSKTTNPEKTASLQFALDRLEAEINPYTLEKSAMEEYVSVYGPRNVTLKGNQLLYKREGRPEYKMIPMSKDKFMFKELDYFIMNFERDDAGNIIAIEGIYANGFKDRTEKTE
ncbi:MAG: S41 family peptidase [Ignavibacteria bacterium]|nr:S41 family peptidase [Ignavibacteria bacterium]